MFSKNGYYEIILKVEGKEIMDISNYSLALNESIYSFYNTAILNVNDADGVMQESLVFSEGSEFDITIKVREHLVNCRYKVTGFTTGVFNSKQNLGGRVSVNLINEWAYSQEIKSTAYEGRITEVLKQLVTKPQFRDLDINDTGNKSIWYQPLMTDAKFINEVLIPNSFSNNSDDSPFFAFIDSNNIFHYRNIASMFKKRAKKNYFYAEEAINTRPELLIDNLKKIQNGTIKMRGHKVFNLNIVGDVVEDRIKIVDYPKGATDKQLLILNDKNLDTDSIIHNYVVETQSEIEQYKANNYFYNRNGILTDRFTFSVMLSKTSLFLKAGEVITLRIPSSLGKTTESILYSGDYLIESLSHNWMGEHSLGVTNISVGRKFAKVPNFLKLKDKLMG